MGPFALSLILLAAVFHATWNLLVKRANAGALFAWLYGAVAVVAYLPISIPLLISALTTFEPRAWIAFVGSGMLLLPWATSVALTAALAPAAVRRWGEVRAMWRAHWRAALGVGVLYPLAYMLVLLAMRVSPVSYVAPAREVSILFGALMGARAGGGSGWPAHRGSEPDAVWHPRVGVRLTAAASAT